MNGYDVLDGGQARRQGRRPALQPLLLLPGPLVARAGKGLVIEGLRVVGMDPDSAVVVGLEAGHGHVSLGRTADLGFLCGDGVLDCRLIFHGPARAVNAALERIVYRARTGFLGTETLAVSAGLPGRRLCERGLASRADLPITIASGHEPRPCMLSLDEAARLGTGIGIPMSSPGRGLAH